MPPAPKEYLRSTSHRGGSVWIYTNSTSPRRPLSISSLTLQTVRAGSSRHRNQLQRFRRLHPFSILLYGGRNLGTAPMWLVYALRNCASGRLRRMRADRFRRDYRRLHRGDDRRRDRGADDLIVEIVTSHRVWDGADTRCLTPTDKPSEFPQIDAFGMPMSRGTAIPFSRIFSCSHCLHLLEVPRRFAVVAVPKMRVGAFVQEDVERFPRYRPRGLDHLGNVPMRPR